MYAVPHRLRLLLAICTTADIIAFTTTYLIPCDQSHHNMTPIVVGVSCSRTIRLIMADSEKELTGETGDQLVILGLATTRFNREWLASHILYMPER